MKKILNPFRYLPLRQASCWGIAVMIMSAIMCWLIPVRLSSMTQVYLLQDKQPLWLSTVEQVVVWLIFAFILYLIGVIFSKSKVRFVDVAAFNLFARIPMDLMLLTLLVPRLKTLMLLLQEQSEAMMSGTATQMSAMVDNMWYIVLMSVIASICAAWYYFWSYKGFAEATNVKNGKGVMLFILGFIVAYVVSGFVLPLLR